MNTKILADTKPMLNEKKLQGHITSMRAYAKLLLQEADKLEAMFEAKEKPAKVDVSAIKFYQRKELSMKRAQNKKL